MFENPDTVVLLRWHWLYINSTILFTWIVMALMVLTSWLVTRKLSSGERVRPWQNALEALVEILDTQITDLTQQPARKYLPFAGTLFLFIAVSNTLAVVPGFVPPTSSLSTTATLALAVMLAVPIYGITQVGLRGYLRRYVQPTVFMLPFNVLGEISRTIALAVRLYGNIMSGTLIVAILLSVIPFLFPVFMELLGLLTGFIQAYIFTVLALVYIASATRLEAEGNSHNRKPQTPQES